MMNKMVPSEVTNVGHVLIKIRQSENKQQRRGVPNNTAFEAVRLPTAAKTKEVIIDLLVKTNSAAGK